MKEAKNKDVFTYLLWGVIIQVVAGFMIPPLYRLIAGPAADKATELVLTSAVYSIVLFVMFYRLKWCPLSPDYVRGKHWDVLFWTVVFTLGSIIPMSFLEEAMPELPNLVEDELTLLVGSNFGYVTICLFAPLVEEMIFRGAILRTLLSVMKGKTWLPIVISALLFALIHMNPAQMPYAFVVGIFLGWIYSRTGSIVPGVLCHWVNNTAAYLMIRLMPHQMADVRMTDLFGGDHRRMGLAIIFSFFILLPALYQLVTRTARRG